MLGHLFGASAITLGGLAAGTRALFHPFAGGIGCTLQIKRPIWRISSRRFSCGHNILWTPTRSFALREMGNGSLCAAAFSDVCVV